MQMPIPKHDSGMNSMDRTKDKLRGFLARYIGDRPLADEEDIFAAGFINSMFAMQLVLFVEREFEISITNQDLKLDNFRSIAAVAALVERKTASLNSTSA
jgi:acyl carrier protein